MTPDPAGGEVSPRKRRRPARLRAGQRPALTVGMVLAWCDAHHERTGAWPTKNSGHVFGTTQETWCAVHLALYRGGRGLPGGTTLAQLLQQRRGVRNLGDLPPLSVEQILAWADAQYERTGAWPLNDSGEIAGAPGEVWRNVDAALTHGSRGLPGGDSLPRLLARERGVRNHKTLPPLSVGQILAWADAFFAEKGRWPDCHDGPIEGAPAETWGCVEAALQNGSRGLPGGATLPRLLQEHRGVRNRKRLPPLTEAQILVWARAHRNATGAWPNENSGPVTGAPGEVWGNVNQSLRQGFATCPAATPSPGSWPGGWARATTPTSRR